MITITYKSNVYTYKNFDQLIRAWGLNGFEVLDLKHNGWTDLPFGTMYLRQN